MTDVSAKGGGSELSKRVMTGVVGGSALLALILWGGRFGAVVLAAILSLAMLWEFAGIVFSLPDKAEKRYALLGIAWLVAFCNALIPRAEYELLLLGFLGLFGYFLFSAQRFGSDSRNFEAHFRELMFSVFGLLYLGFLPLFLPLIRDSANGAHWIILFLIVNWAGDTGAYFAGKRFGKTKLYPLISPKKTVEGGLGGLVAGCVFALVYKAFFFSALSVGSTLGVALLIGVIAPIGDLGESFLKRAFNTKDSGSILPGHGGFMDRFDGVVFSLPVMYACVKLL